MSLLARLGKSDDAGKIEVTSLGTALGLDEPLGLDVMAEPVGGGRFDANTILMQYVTSDFSTFNRNPTDVHHG